MYAFSLVALTLVASVRASVYVTNPIQASTCTGGQSCLVQWVDNGQSPLLADIGECQVGLYSGEFNLVQSLPSVDVSTVSSFQFTPDPAVGPNGQYYLVFTASGINYRSFSGSFTLAGMSGTTTGGGSSASVSSPTTDSSASAGSTTGTSVTGVTTASNPSDTTAATGTPTLTTPTVTTTPTASSHSSTTTSKTSTSASASATSTGAAGRVGTSTSLGALGALLALSGVLAF